MTPPAFYVFLPTSPIPPNPQRLDSALGRLPAAWTPNGFPEAAWAAALRRSGVKEVENEMKLVFFDKKKQIKQQWWWHCATQKEK